MKPLKLNQPIPSLTTIGSISLLGATPTDGDPQAAACMIYGQAEDSVNCGIFSVTRGEFSMIYPFTEHAGVLEGTVELTDEKTGQTVRYTAGDSWFIQQGTAVHWKILSDRLVKHYVAITDIR